MKLLIAIDMGNAAFEGREVQEAADILWHAAARLEMSVPPVAFSVCDSNGNAVGTVAIVECDA